MEKLQPFERNDAESLYRVASYLYKETKFWQTYLTGPQMKLMAKLLCSSIPKHDRKTLWSHVLNGNAMIYYENMREPDQSVILSSKAFTLRMRSLLWGKAASFYYDIRNETSSAETNNKDIFELLEADDSDVEEAKGDKEKANGESSEKSAKGSSKAREVVDEDDNYDDEEDEDNDDDDDDAKMVDASDGSSEDIKFHSNGSVIIDLTNFEAPIEQTSQAKTPENDDSQVKLTTTKMSTSLNSSDTIVTTQELEIIKNLNDVYHNFEGDHETLLKRQKLEVNDKIVDEQTPSTNYNNDNQSLTAQLSMNIGSANLSLKYLLKLIDNNKEKVPNLTSRQLRNLIHDVKKSKSKWSSDDRIGQEELYEACEMVLTELRGYTQHSTPFLTKVSKREAPNYSQIIKKPMDLNTVMRKLKGLEYKSKKDFADDLMIIWSNCLLYNADPAHHLRKNALAMKKKTLSLLPLIPNITIKTKAEYEKEEKELEEQRQRSAMNQASKASKKGQKRTNNGVTKLDTPDGVSSEATPIPNQSTQMIAADTPISTGNNTSVVAEEEINESQTEIFDGAVGDVDDPDFNEENDPETQVWKNYTSKLRGDFLLRRSKLFVKGEDNKLKLNAEAEAVLRDPAKMSEFMKVAGDIQSVSQDEPALKKQKIENDKEGADSEEPGIEDDLYLTEYDIINGVPFIKYRGESENDLSKKENMLLEKLNREKAMKGEANGDTHPASDFVPPRNGLNKIIIENISHMQEIRSICFKISLIRQMQQNQFIHHSQLRAPSFETLKDSDLDPLEQAAEEVVSDHKFNSTFIYNVLRRNVAKLLMNTGFETADSYAVDTISQVAEQFLGNLIKTIKLHLETTSQNKIIGKSNVVLLSLIENGISKPDDLYTYVQDGVFKQNNKLVDLKSKLKGFLKELLRPTLMSFQAEKDLINEKNFGDNSDQFITGDFSNELGEDFFGFRELGLEKEFKMLSSSIPLHLLNSKLSSSLNQNANADNRSVIEEFDKNVKYKRLSKADIDQQIGLLQPFLRKFFEKSRLIYMKNFKNNNTQNKELPLTNNESEMLILEDEDLPQKQKNIRPRLPPNGKITSVKKKTVGTGFFLDENDSD